MQPRNVLGMPRAHAAILFLALALGLLACAVDGGSRKTWDPVEPQQWQKERGPVVPHDTFPRDCSLCHEGSSWHAIRSDFSFDHAAETGLALVGRHEKAECLRCHNDRGPVEVFAQRGCVGCHEDVHQGELGDTCSVCHEESSNDWRPKAAVAEHAKTRFPLAGAHASTACWACHPGAQVGNFANTTTNCVDCHAKDLAAANEPDHAIQGWTDSCQRCHLPTDWSRAGFDHRFFPLQGGHAQLDCNACHAPNDFGGLDSACFACHSDDYAAARDHASQNYSTDCTQCHTVYGWEGGNFAHTGITSGCIACHADEYATAPEHVAQNYSTECGQCHTFKTWKGGSFPHTGITNGCNRCHADDYAATTQPNHTTSGFGTSCEQCHDTRIWGDGQFDHSEFPIFSGNHSGLSCQDCHPVPGAFRQFTCISCHEHSARNTNGEHNRVSGYSYQSSACYSCHPNGHKD